jgi:NADPH-dependent ferric siderophore reductase
MKILNSIMSKAFRNALLIHKEKIAKNTFHLKLKLTNSFENYSAGQQLRIFVGLENVLAINDLIRTYSVWHYDANKLEVDIAVCTFSNGQGAKWASEINVGDTIYFSGPKGKFVFNPEGKQYVFIGDISALAPFYEIAKQINPNKQIWSYIYSRNQDDFFKDKFSELDFNFNSQNDNSAKPVIANLDILELDKQSTIIYIAGEVNFCKVLFAYFRNEKKIFIKNLYTKPFWHPNKKGLE